MTNSDHNALLDRPKKERITNEEIDDLANKLLDCSREGIYAFARAVIAAAHTQNPMTNNLSPAAASIVKAFDDRYELLGPLEENWQEVCIAAALRALDAQLGYNVLGVRTIDSSQILLIATELED